MPCYRWNRLRRWRRGGHGPSEIGGLAVPNLRVAWYPYRMLFNLTGNRLTGNRLAGNRAVGGVAA